MAHIVGDLSNDLYDASDPTIDGMLELTKEDGIGPYTIFLGVFVSLIPKLIPRILPNFVENNDLKERFDNEEYLNEVEIMFTDRFAKNLKVFERLVEAWRDNSLELSDLGLGNDNIGLAKEDKLVAGEPESFQTDLLKGIRFLQYRVSRIGRRDDRISQIADVVWNVLSTGYRTARAFIGAN